MEKPPHMCILSKLTKEEGNRSCADCGARQPRWASVNLGVLICMGCSGIHRSLGVHISKVRSVTLDNFRLEEVEQLERIGNIRANAFWEANLPGRGEKPGPHTGRDVLQNFIRDKYERQKFIAGKQLCVRQVGPDKGSTSTAVPCADLMSSTWEGFLGRLRTTPKWPVGAFQTCFQLLSRHHANVVP